MARTMHRAGRRAIAALLALALVLGGTLPLPSAASAGGVPGLYSAADVCTTGSGHAETGRTACALHCVAAPNHAAILPQSTAPTPFSWPDQAIALDAIGQALPEGGEAPDAHRPRAPPIPGLST